MTAPKSAVRVLQKIFVGNLPWTVSSKELQMYFSKFGPVTSSNVVLDKNIGMSKGFGFIVFGTREGYNSAINKQIHFLEGRCLTVQPATS